MRSNTASEAIDEIGRFANSHPFLSLHFLGLYLLIFSLVFLLYLESAADQKREEALLEVTKASREKAQNLLTEMITNLQKEAPKKADEANLAKTMEMIESTSQRINSIQNRQDEIMLRLDNITVFISGKSGR